MKTHSVLSNAFKEAEAIEETKVYKISDKEYFRKFFESHLKTTPNCDYDVCLADGTKFDYDETFYTGCTNVAEGSSSALKESCVKLIVDVNGKKGPNQAGKDIYNLWVTRQDIIPEGESDTCSNLDCGAYVLAYHRLYDAANPYRYYSPIKNCETQEGGTCSTCNEGYHLDNNKCLIGYVDKCSVYKNDGSCQACQSGY